MDEDKNPFDDNPIDQQQSQSSNDSSDDDSQSNSNHHSSSFNQNVKQNSTQNLEFKKLTWEDYQGQPDEDDPAIAHTKWKIGYNYTLKQQDNDNIYYVDVDVWCKVDPSSWIKTKFQELLNHEQGHYYIGLICALQFKQKVSQFQFTENHKTEISQLFNENLKDHLEMERQYDIETLNMLNTAKQKLWDLKLLNNLKSLQKFH